ncbi:HGGxSTG domain-containing protein [Ahrensia sp. 13_GOM-1096m]|uniref:HGGxSTG domain-containing protein n=1 Tax=Ahrensia sp. 13_GOM-1096m TaxID=1380380 RepID=UPI0005576BC9|nr:helix-turn-helix transcriptional regulator [Ahrensia sp. 13_GOM-1096m]
MRTIWFLSGIDLEAHRARAGLTQQQLAIKAECHVQTVRFWEGQRSREDCGGLYSKAVQRMARAMNLEPLGESPVQSPNGRISREDLEAVGLGWFYDKSEPKSPRHCNARRPDGSKCRKRPIAGKQRCAQHGGLSTGPKTAEGRKCISDARRKQ